MKELGVNVSSEELYDLIQGNNIHPNCPSDFWGPKHWSGKPLLQLLVF